MPARNESNIPIDIPEIDPQTLSGIINGAAAVGHALALLKPKDRSATTLHLLRDLPVMRQNGETTEAFIVAIAIETCLDVNYPERLYRQLQDQGRMPTNVH